MKHFTFFLFQKITMFHFACGLLIINEDFTVRTHYFIILEDFRPLHAAINTKSNAIHSGQFRVVISVDVSTCISMLSGSIPGRRSPSCHVALFDRSIVQL